MTRASISLDEELFEVHSSCILDVELSKDDSTCMSDLVVDSLNSISYHSIVSAETVDAFVTTDTFNSLEDRIIIGDLYVRSHGVATVQEAVTSSSGTEAHVVTQL